VRGPGASFGVRNARIFTFGGIWRKRKEEQEKERERDEREKREREERRREREERRERDLLFLFFVFLDWAEVEQICSGLPPVAAESALGGRRFRFRHCNVPPYSPSFLTITCRAT